MLTVNGTAAADTIVVTATAVQVNSGTVTYTTLESLTVNGLAGNDTVTVNGTSVPTTLNGGADNDTVTINAPVAVPMTVEGGLGTDALTVNGTANDDTFVITGTAIQVNAGTVTYFNLESLTVNGLAGNDTFTVNSTGAPTTLNGGEGNDTFTINAPLADPVTIDGNGGNDTLTVNGTAGDDTFVITGTTVQVNLVSVTYTALASPLVVNGLAGNDAFTVNGTAVATALNGGTGNDTLTINATGTGAPVTALGEADDDTFTVNTVALTAAVTADGGAGSDTLTVNGTDNDDTFTVTATTVTRTGAAAITYAAVEALSVNAGQGADTINVLSTAAGTSTTVNAGAGNDTVNVSSDAPTNDGNLDGIAGTLTLDGGAGTNTLVVSDFGQTATANNNVVATSTQITGLAGATNASVINYASGGGTLTLRGSNTLGDLFNVRSTLAGITTTVAGNGGDDTINVSSDAALDGTNLVNDGNLDGIAGTLTLDGGAGTNTLIVSDFGATTPNSNGNVIVTSSQITGFAGATDATVINYTSAGGTLTIRGSNTLGDLFNVRSTLVMVVTTVAGNGGNDTVNVSSDAPANTGNLDGIAGTLTLDGGAGTNALVVSDFGQSATANGNVVVTSTQITGLAGATNASVINYASGGGTLTLRGSDTLADTFHVRSTLAAFTTVVAGNGGNDTLNVSSDAALDGTNLVNAGNLDGIAGTLTLDGGPGTNTLVVSDFGQAATANSNVVVTNSQVTGFAGAANATVINYASGGGILTLRGSDTLADTFNVRSTLAGIATLVNGNGGNDTVNVSSDAPTNDGSLDGIAGGLSLDAGTGSNTVVLSDFGATTTNSNGNVVVTSSLITGFAGATDATVINYAATGGTLALRLRGSNTLAETFSVRGTLAGANTLTIDGNSGNDTFNLQAISGATTVNGDAGDDTIHVGSLAPVAVNAINAALTVNGGAGNDTLSVDDSGETSNNTGTLTATTLTGLGLTAAITYGTLEALTVALGRGNDRFTVLSTHPGTTRLNGNDGDDIMVICSTGGATSLVGGTGNDEFVFAPGAVLTGGTIDGGNGTDLLNYAAYTTGVSVSLLAGTATGTDGIRGINNVVGGSGNDSLIGDDEVNRLEGRGGNDTINAARGNDTILGGSGDDSLFGGDGDDRIDGNEGNDQIDGLAGSDTILAGVGDDLVLGSEGDDCLDGGTGQDTILGLAGNDTISGGAGNDQVDAGTGDDLVSGGDGNDVVNGGPGNDVLSGDLGNDTLAGGTGLDPNLTGTGSDVLSGGAGNDQLLGQDGNDTLFGGTEGDQVFGGPGFDDILIADCNDILRRLDFIDVGGLGGEGGRIFFGQDPTAARTAAIQTIAELIPLTVTVADCAPSPLGTQALSFLNSAENRTHLVVGYYQKYLGRTPEAAALSYWLGQLTAGARQETVLVGLLSSAEYYSRSGGTDAAYIRALYRDVLGRTAGQAEVDYWLGSLGRIGRGDVAASFASSDEYRGALIHSYYTRYLRRAPDAAGLAYWLSQLRQGLTQEQVQAGLICSSEYQQMTQRLHGSGLAVPRSSDNLAAYIRGLYQDVLGRAASPVEVESWLYHVAWGHA
jgi:acrosin